MSGYVRPMMEEQTFLDADGARIPYGSRWGKGSPPDEAYGVTGNLERYAPLHEVAEALVAWLAATFDVRVEDDLATIQDLSRPQDGMVRSVRVAPNDASAAPMTFAFSSFPGVFLHAGHLLDFAVPMCGCDACDEPVEWCVEQLEWRVRAIAGGGFSESVDVRAGTVSISIVDPGVGSVSGDAGEVGWYPADRIRLVAESPGGTVDWRPWPSR